MSDLKEALKYFKEEVEKWPVFGDNGPYIPKQQGDSIIFYNKFGTPVLIVPTDVYIQMKSNGWQKEEVQNENN